VPFKAQVLRPLNLPAYEPKPRLSAKDRGYDADHRFWRKAILARDQICRRCGNARASHADHIVSISKRPDLRLDLRNGRGLCASCHSVVTAKHDGGFGNKLRAGK